MLARIADFPQEARRVFEALLTLELQAPSSLQIQVDRHLGELEEAHRRNEFLDLETARELARMSERLLDLYPSVSEADRRLIQAAVLYFVLEQDASRDSGSLLGLDDDARVMQAVTAHLLDT